MTDLEKLEIFFKNKIKEREKKLNISNSPDFQKTFDAGVICGYKLAVDAIRLKNYESIKDEK